MQCSWTYIAKAGKPYQVGLYHGTRSGHLLIYVNRRIMLIDFGVRDTKSFSFFIEDDLCHIRLVRKGDRMYYYFEIDKEAPTPANERRKRYHRRNFRQMMLWFILPLFLTGLFGYWLQEQKEKREQAREEQLLRILAPLQDVQGLIVAAPDSIPGRFTYVFETEEGEIVKGAQYVEQVPANFAIPKQGSLCLIRYRKTNPQINELVLE